MIIFVEKNMSGIWIARIGLLFTLLIMMAGPALKWKVEYIFLNIFVSLTLFLILLDFSVKLQYRLHPEVDKMDLLHEMYADFIKTIVVLTIAFVGLIYCFS